MREYEIKRKTAETEISVKLNLDGRGESDIGTSIGFFNHMMTLFSVHSGIDLILRCKGDTDVDYHHSVEDTAIALGEALRNALGDKRGIKRYGFFLLPMDEALVTVALDISGRSHLSFNCPFPTEKIGSFDTELVEEFFSSLVRYAGITLHIDLVRGRNSHHIAEAVFKGFAHALREAVSVDERKKDVIPSSKGVL